MDKKNLKLLNNIAFKSQCYRKNFDMINKNDNIITEYDGTISELRISEKKIPLIIGEYGFSVWNIKLGKELNVNFNKLIKEHHCENTYDELSLMIKNKLFNVEDYNKIVFIHSLVIHPNYRKQGITEEFIEFIYRDFYNEKVAIIALVKPFQNNSIDANYYLKHKFVITKETHNSPEISILASEYYSLNELMKKQDVELNEYKLFSIVTKCGFNRIDDSHLFLFSPENIHERLIEKTQKSINISKTKNIV